MMCSMHELRDRSKMSAKAASRDYMTDDDSCPAQRYEPLVPQAWSEAEVLQLLRDDPHSLWFDLASVFYSPTLSGDFKFKLVEMLLPLGDMRWRAWVWSAAAFHVREDIDCCTSQFYDLALATLMQMDDEAERTEEAGSLTDFIEDLIMFQKSYEQAWSWYESGEPWQKALALHCLTDQEDPPSVLSLVAAEVNAPDPLHRAIAVGGLSDLVTRPDLSMRDLEPHVTQYLSLLATFEADPHWYVRSAAQIARDLYEYSEAEIEE